ncbi:hypothetical protein ACQ4PT_052957 [Festuca glaucescens]
MAEQQPLAVVLSSGGRRRPPLPDLDPERGDKGKSGSTTPVHQTPVPRRREQPAARRGLTFAGQVHAQAVLQAPLPAAVPCQAHQGHARQEARRREAHGMDPTEEGGVGPGAGAVGDGAEAERLLDKTFGFGKNFGAKYELGKEVGRGQFGHTCSALLKKGEYKGQTVAVKIISKAKVREPCCFADLQLLTWGFSINFQMPAVYIAVTAMHFAPLKLYGSC